MSDDTSKSDTADAKSDNADAGNTETVSKADLDAALARLESLQKELSTSRDEVKKLHKDRDDAKRKARDADSEKAAKDGDIEKLRENFTTQLKERDDAYASLQTKFVKNLLEKEVKSELAKVSIDADALWNFTAHEFELKEHDDGRVEARAKNSTMSIAEFAEKWALDAKKDYLLKSKRQNGTGVEKSGDPARTNGAPTIAELHRMTRAEQMAVFQKYPALRDELLKSVRIGT